MRPLLVVSICIISALSACQQNSREASGDEDETAADSAVVSPNQKLYEEVMDIHDAVMPKMNDLHKAKTSLRTRLELPGLGENERQQIQNKISRIDSASESMMVWMRQFNPLPDSAGEDKARAYLEGELVKVKEVEKKILGALRTAAAED